MVGGGFQVAFEPHALLLDRVSGTAVEALQRLAEQRRLNVKKFARCDRADRTLNVYVLAQLVMCTHYTPAGRVAWLDALSQS